MKYKKLIYTIGILAGLIFAITVILRNTRALGELQKVCSNCKITNDKGEVVNARVYRNNLSSVGKKVNDIVIHFPDIEKEKFITISIESELIGVNNYGHGYKTLLAGSYIYFSKNSFTFTPINEGFESIANYHIKINKHEIEFDTFGKIKRYGDSLKVIL